MRFRKIWIWKKNVFKKHFTWKCSNDRVKQVLKKLLNKNCQERALLPLEVRKLLKKRRYLQQNGYLEMIFWKSRLQFWQRLRKFRLKVQKTLAQSPILSSPSCPRISFFGIFFGERLDILTGFSIKNKKSQTPSPENKYKERSFSQKTFFFPKKCFSGGVECCSDYPDEIFVPKFQKF